MRPATFEEREDLVRRSGGQELLTFIDTLEILRHEHGLSHLELLSKILHSKRRTDLPETFLLRVRRELAEMGVELTPAEARHTLEDTLYKLREELQEFDISDIDLLKKFARTSRP